MLRRIVDLILELEFERVGIDCTALLGALLWNKFCVLVALRIILVIELNGRTAFLVRSLLQLLGALLRNKFCVLVALRIILVSQLDI